MEKVQVLKIDPPKELCFEGPFDDVLSQNISLMNPTEGKVAYKVKTTAPKQYCVRPNTGVILPKQTVDVKVMLQPLENVNEEKIRHKFMVLSAAMSDEDDPTAMNKFWQSKYPNELGDTKLKVVLKTSTGGSQNIIPTYRITGMEEPLVETPSDHIPLTSASQQSAAAMFSADDYHASETNERVSPRGVNQILKQKKVLESNLAFSESEINRLMEIIQKNKEGGLDEENGYQWFSIVLTLLGMILSLVAGIILGHNQVLDF